MGKYIRVRKNGIKDIIKDNVKPYRPLSVCPSSYGRGQERDTIARSGLRPKESVCVCRCATQYIDARAYRRFATGEGGQPTVWLPLSAFLLLLLCHLLCFSHFYSISDDGEGGVEQFSFSKPEPIMTLVVMLLIFSLFLIASSRFCKGIDG